MSTTYKSKVDLWLICLILAVVFLIIAPVLLYAFSWIAVVLTLLLLLLIFYCLFGVEYVVQDNTLSIRCGILVNDKVDIMRITKIESTKSFISAPAASSDRIALYLSNQRTPVIISPKNKKDFIAKLKSINPSINADLVTA